MNWKDLRENKWLIVFFMSTAGCIAVVIYLLLRHFGVVTSVLGTIIGFFREVIIGGILAYLVNPIAIKIKKSLFKNSKLKDGGWALSVTLALILVLLLLVFLLGLVIPQLIDSIISFTEQAEKYFPSLSNGLMNMGIDLSLIGINFDKGPGSLKETISTVFEFTVKNGSAILDVLTGAGKGILSFALSFILAIYLISAKDEIKQGTIRLIRALVNEKKTEGIINFFTQCSRIFLHYIYYSLIEGLLIGVINAVFMLILGMPYVSLVSVVVGVCNLIPTVGPIIGGLIGAFVLVLENPMQALFFLIFTVVLQLFDGYILKPKLFGNSLGVSGVLIMVAFVVGGNIFGIVGILLSIPAIAIIDMIYHEYILKWLENRRKKSE